MSISETIKEYSLRVLFMTPIIIVGILLIPLLIFPAVRRSLFADSIYEATIGAYKESRKYKKGPAIP